MRQFVLEEGALEGVAPIVSANVQAIGGVVYEQTLSRTRFDGLRPTGEAFARAGYVGVAQAWGSKDATFRIRVWAQWPLRLVLSVLGVGALATLALFVVQPDPSVWVWTAIASWGGLALALLVYAGTIEASRELERRLTETLAERLTQESGPRVWTKAEWAAHKKRLDQAARIKVKQIRADRLANPPPTPAATVEGAGIEGDEAAKPGRWGRFSRRQQHARAEEDATPQGPEPAQIAAVEPTPKKRRFGLKRPALPFGRKKKGEGGGEEA